MFLLSLRNVSDEILSFRAIIDGKKDFKKIVRTYGYYEYTKPPLSATVKWLKIEKIIGLGETW